jgi:hypothetical protein
MTGQDLIDQLQELITKHGDQEVIWGETGEKLELVGFNDDEDVEPAFVLD